MALMSTKGMSKKDPILMRLYKKESELEVWKKGSDGRYALLKSYPICRWSGQLGPKVREGDRQAPEGFYTVTPALMNPNSSYFLSFNTGYPNAFDRAHGRSGSHLMVHGSCSSRGCYAMTDEAISEVYALAREAFSGGQKGFQFQAYPFRMTAQNLAKARLDPNIAFWKNLKEGADHFEVAKVEPNVEVCGKRYSFNTQNCSPVNPSLMASVQQKQARDEQEVADLVSRGTPAVRFAYEDGGGHASFQEFAVASASDDRSGFAVLDARPRRNLGDVSRPDALAAGVREIPLDPSGRPKAETALAFAAAEPTKAVAAPVKTVAEPVKTAAAPVRVASAAPAAVQAKPAETVVAASESKPLYKRVFGDVFSGISLFGNKSDAAPADAPVPPSRGTAPADPKRVSGTPVRSAQARPAD
jgi:murein L,D-transpeptidase YafK